MNILRFIPFVLLAWNCSSQDLEVPVEIVLRGEDARLLSGDLGGSSFSVLVSTSDGKATVDVRVFDSTTKVHTSLLSVELGDGDFRKLSLAKIRNGDHIAIIDDDGDMLPDRKIVVAPGGGSVARLEIIEIEEVKP